MQFVYPSFLFALAAIAIPIIIHLFHFRRFKKVIFSDLRFLKQVQQQQQSKQKLKDLLILLSRILAILFLVLAFAQPYIPSATSLALHGAEAVSLFIDNSFSMNGEGADGNLFESAKNKARAIVKAYGTDDQFQILSNDFEGRHQRLVNQSDALTWIDELTISPSSVTLSKVLQRQKQALEKAGTQTKISYLISDFQEHICDVASIPEDTGTLLYFIPVKAGASHNISIDSAWFTNPVIQLNKPVTLNVRIRNYSEAAIENVPITLSLDGRQKGLQNISCKAFDYEDISFSFTPSRGMQNGEISILDHPVTFDDKLFFHFTPVNQYNVLCINGTLPNTFIQKVFESDPSYILRQISQNQISYSTFREQQLIILNEPQELSSGLLQELKKYIEEGGQLLIIPPSSTSHNLNVLLTQLQLPALGQLQKQSFKLSTINTQDMLFKDVFQKLPQNMDLPAINQYYELERTNSTIGRELMELPNGSPFAWQGSLKKGNVVVLATPLQLSWSSFPQHAIFVPFMLKLGTGKPEREALYYTIGEAEWIPYRQTAASEKLVTLKGNGQEYVMQTSLRNGKPVLYFDQPISKAGHYQLLPDRARESIQSVAFNFNRQESDVRAWPKDKMETFINRTGVKVSDQDATVLQNNIASQLNGIAFWRYCVWLTLLFVLIEILLLRFLQ